MRWSASISSAVGTLLHQLTGDEMWDAIASLFIAALLGLHGGRPGRDTKELLIGEAADPAVRLGAYDVLRGARRGHRRRRGAHDAARPDQRAARRRRVQLVEDGLTADHVSRLCNEVED